MKISKAPKASVKLDINTLIRLLQATKKTITPFSKIITIELRGEGEPVVIKT